MNESSWLWFTLESVSAVGWLKASLNVKQDFLYLYPVFVVKWAVCPMFRDLRVSFCLQHDSLFQLIWSSRLLGMCKVKFCAFK